VINVIAALLLALFLLNQIFVYRLDRVAAPLPVRDFKAATQAHRASPASKITPQALR
jgi:hypothetical protein